MSTPAEHEPIESATLIKSSDESEHGGHGVVQRADLLRIAFVLVTASMCGSFLSSDGWELPVCS
jgi:hypothetical protein